MKMKKNNLSRIFGLAALGLGLALPLLPCTVAVVSGKATPDGRALLWKNRDTPDLENKILYIPGGRFAFLALVNASDNWASNVWAGVNTAGLALMNSQSSDLNPRDPSGKENGYFIRLALAECTDARDFEDLLLSTNGRRNTAANFGLIDAEGNACLYEAGPSSFIKYDAADLKTAPQGFIIRTNFAFSAAKKEGGGGYIRYERASRLFQAARAENRLTYRFIIQEAARDLANEKLHSYPEALLPSRDPGSPLYVNTNDTINRNSTASAVIFQAPPGRDRPDLATMWVLLGQPVAAVAVPLWPRVPGVPAALTGDRTAPLNDISRSLTSVLYPDQRSEMSRYLNINKLQTFSGTGLPVRTKSLEEKAFDRVDKKLREWARRQPSLQEAVEFEGAIASLIYDNWRLALSGRTKALANADELKATR